MAKGERGRAQPSILASHGTTFISLAQNERERQIRKFSSLRVCSKRTDVLIRKSPFSPFPPLISKGKRGRGGGRICFDWRKRGRRRRAFWEKGISGNLIWGEMAAAAAGVGGDDERKRDAE